MSEIGKWGDPKPGICQRCHKPVRRTVEDLGFCKSCLAVLATEYARKGQDGS